MKNLFGETLEFIRKRLLPKTFQKSFKSFKIYTQQLYFRNRLWYTVHICIWIKRNIVLNIWSIFYWKCTENRSNNQVYTSITNVLKISNMSALEHMYTPRHILNSFIHRIKLWLIGGFRFLSTKFSEICLLKDLYREK